MSRAWISTDPDGRTRYRFHQSWLGDIDLCLERSRAGLMGELTDPPNDASGVGTAMHHAIEESIGFHLEYQEWPDLDTTLTMAHEHWNDVVQLEEGFRWVKRGTKAAATYLSLATRMWWEQVRPTLRPVASEVKFGPYVLYEDDTCVVEVAGTIDYVDEVYGLGDWKTGGAHTWAGKDWEKQRWAIQPTVYTFGWHQRALDLGLEPPTIPMPFTFWVMRDDKRVQIVDVVRRPEDWEWLRRKVRAVVRQIEVAGLEGPWPLNDQHALCSEKWCPNWSNCKGLDVATSWPK